MSVINNLIALPCHARTMPMSPTSSSMNLATKIGIDHLESACIRKPREILPPHADRLTNSVAQIALDPLPTQNNRQEPKHRDDAWDNRDVAPCYDVFGSHVKRPNVKSSATPGRNATDCQPERSPALAAAHR